MHVKDVLDDLDIRVKLPQHWYSTDVSNEFEDAELVRNDEIIKIRVEGEKNTKVIIIDVDDGMSVVSLLPDKKVIGVKYLKNKDDFEYIGKPSELYF
ncbi:hypothetical protein SAMN05216439_1290 [Methanobrevibacter gottschalkii]|uniref:Uncharacterized protein n=2 Tax=Methanobrevibacter gottschalkii TaxID=190974 RepID=A0A3N5B2D8_9EURY|nr:MULTISPECIES: hypothetical protein [Methanobrevibacter]OED01735.1 hypothetical protein A9505_02090 [Methanobrevibacter sp. A27]RPF51427.1 hypothetical protein EDC42_0751 [Methanobrevibacter gottschalkii DSM 11977]SEK67031.1 hypothetical protein SAMN05216439_1290 [Methanobrevibacter gottschalkii]